MCFNHHTVQHLLELVGGEQLGVVHHLRLVGGQDVERALGRVEVLPLQDVGAGLTRYHRSLETEHR